MSSILVSLLDADARVQLRNRQALIVSLALPVVWMIALGIGKRGALFPPTSRLAIAIALGLTSVAILGYTMIVARDRETGVFQRLRVTPAPTWAIMGSRLAIQVVSVLIMTAVLLILGAVMLNLTLSPAAYVLTLAVAVLGAAVFLGVGQAVVGLLKSYDTVNAIGRLVFIPLVALGMFSNISVFGSTLETIARWSPGGVLISMLAGAMTPSTWSTDTWWSVLVSIGYAIVFVALGIRWFQWESR
ncbi:MAG TPA: ABC transporter permease [Candidatus Dormibacteraeota bacterium]|nr:ABC transporter permease [Candidatus Dormibacteraeota bacterium]